MAALPSKTEFLGHIVDKCADVPEGNADCPICREPFTSEVPTTTSNDTKPSDSESKTPASPTNVATEPSATQSSATPSSATPSSATTSSATPSSATHSSANTFSATTSSATQSSQEAQSHMPVKVPCCKKLFCRGCLLIWLNMANTCPMCRAQLYNDESVERDFESEAGEEEEDWDNMPIYDPDWEYNPDLNYGTDLDYDSDG